MLTNVKNVLVNEDGATLVEYALIVSLIAVTCITAISLLGTNISKSFNAIGKQLSGA